MSAYRAGDLIEGRKGETVISGRLEKAANYEGGLRIPDAGWSPMSLEREGYTITVVERGLPTEPGTVITWDNGAYLPQFAQLDGGYGNYGWRYHDDTGGYWLSSNQLLERIDGNEFTVLGVVATPKEESHHV